MIVFFIHFPYSKTNEEIPDFSALAASPLALVRDSSWLANGGDIGKMSCVILIIYKLPDSHLSENRCIVFHARVTGENPHTENRRNKTPSYAICVNLTLIKTF